MMSKLQALARCFLFSAATVLATASPLLAQGSMGLGGQSLRPYHFVFLAYALAWILVLGWVVSIGRRISRLADRLEG